VPQLPAFRGLSVQADPRATAALAGVGDDEQKSQTGPQTRANRSDLF
jgi:hypothetical protein